MEWSIAEERHETDVLIVGGGAAGTMAAFECAQAGVRVIQATKGRATSGTTTVARGGFAAAMAPGDSPEIHLQEVLQYGGELINPDLAKTWTHDIIDVVRDLRAWGAEFITDDEGGLDLKMFPSHTYPRALHHHDTTGNMVTKTLSRRLRSDARIGQHPHTAIVDLITDGGRVVGAWGVDYSHGRLVVFAAREVILATGGGSGLFYVNDNPPQVTGDGYVLGFRAGAPLVGIEMIDFQAMCCAPEALFGFAPHPTGFINAGAIFLNREGEAFLKRYFPETAEKSARSEVILAMAKEIHAGRAGLTGGIYMDATQVPMTTIQKQIPHVYKTCLARGIDITRTPLEVAPGSHTWLGGLEIDVDGGTSVPGLWAAGETGGGIHGGNRIGGSALSASLVYGRRAGRAASAQVKEDARGASATFAGIPASERAWLEALVHRDDGPLQKDVRMRCRMLAHEKLGPIRDAGGCQYALDEFERIESEEVPNMCLGEGARASEKIRGHELESALSVRNLALLGKLLATAAVNRKESRGAHFRIDYPEVNERDCSFVTRLTRGEKGKILLEKDPLKTAVPTSTPKREVAYTRQGEV